MRAILVQQGQGDAEHGDSFFSAQDVCVISLDLIPCLTSLKWSSQAISLVRYTGKGVISLPPQFVSFYWYTGHVCSDVREYARACHITPPQGVKFCCTQGL
jgi:hypothetical protein